MQNPLLIIILFFNITTCNSQNTNEITSNLRSKIDNNDFYTILSDTILVGKTIFNESGIKKINKDTVMYKNEDLIKVFAIFIKKIKGTDYIIQIDMSIWYPIGYRLISLSCKNRF